MAFSSYSGLSTPNDVLEAIADYIANEGYTIIANCVDDLDIYRMSTSDGKKLVFRDRTSNYFYVLRRHPCRYIRVYFIIKNYMYTIN